MNGPTQVQMFYAEQRKIADRDNLLMEMIRNQEITNDELAKLIEKHPYRYGHFAGFVGKIKEAK